MYGASARKRKFSHFTDLVGLLQGCPPPQNSGLGLGLGNRTMIALVGNTLGLELKKFEDCWYYNLHWIKKYL